MSYRNQSTKSAVFQHGGVEAKLIEPQKDTASSMNGNYLSAHQLYQHDPMLVLFKDTLRLHDLWNTIFGLVQAQCYYQELSFSSGR